MNSPVSYIWDNPMEELEKQRAFKARLLKDTKPEPYDENGNWVPEDEPILI